MRDLEHGPARGLVWDAEAVDRVHRFFRGILRLNGGQFEGAPFEPAGWQSFIIGSLFGWKRAATGLRRFRTGYVEGGKGCGKSPLAAGIGHYMLLADGEARAEVYACATKKDQAMVLFRDAMRMWQQSPALKARLTPSGVGDKAWNLADIKSGGFFRPISNDDNGQSGPRPHCGLVDEVHEHKTADAINMMEAGFKFRTQPLLLMITNSGFDRQSICYQQHEYGIRAVTIEDGREEYDAFFAFICGMDEGDDPMADEACWIKANPSYPVIPTPEYLRAEVTKARGMPSKASEVRRLNFCQWVDAANPWIDLDLWRACEVPSEEWAPGDGEPVGALDLSGKRDLTALALLWPDTMHARVEFWTPADTLRERARSDRVPYDVWVDRGHVTATPGRAINLRWVAERLGELQHEIGLRRVAYDPYNIAYLQQALDELGITGIELIPHGQGYFRAKDSGLWMPRSIEVLEQSVSTGRLRVQQNPVLTFASASAILEADKQNNRVFDKRRSRGRIDGIVALAMAAGFADAGATDARSDYEDVGLLTV